MFVFLFFFFDLQLYCYQIFEYHFISISVLTSVIRYQSCTSLLVLELFRHIFLQNRNSLCRLQWYLFSYSVFLTTLVTVHNGGHHWGDSSRPQPGPLDRQTPSRLLGLPGSPAHRRVRSMEPVCYPWLPQSPLETQGARYYLSMFLPACFAVFQISDAACVKLKRKKKLTRSMTCTLTIICLFWSVVLRARDKCGKRRKR